MKENTFDVIIIGSGPAGYTAAIYATRADLSVAVFTGMQPGGQLTTTTDVENFPGYPDGVSGPDMMLQLQKQAERFGTNVKFEQVKEVKFNKEEGGEHIVITDSDKEYFAEAVIISTGASAKYLGLEDEKKYAGSGVSACATCDGFFYRGKDVAVVGGGDTATEEAQYLSKICNKVYLIVRRDKLRASQIMQDRVSNTDNIEILYNHELKGLSGSGVVEEANIINNQTNEETKLKIDGVFIAIGHKPNTDIFKGQLKMDDLGYLITDDKTTKTEIPGVFAAGDVQDHIYRQAITAAGTGCMAAMDAEKYLTGTRSKQYFT